MIAKKELVAQMAAKTGATRLLSTLPGRSSLIVLNYHRVGDASATAYDSGTFSCTAAELDQQMSVLKQWLPVLTLDEAVRVIHGQEKLSETSVLLTFDDGYRDNYAEAFPALRRHGLSAAFFLPTAFIGTGSLPWWDVIAFIVKSSRKEWIEFNAPEPASFSLDAAHRDASIRSILKLFKRPSMKDADRFLCNLEEACEAERPPRKGERCFLNWEEAREMERGGMCFGSHTHTHEILSRLTLDQQVTELRTSREILEKELQHPVHTLAYPVGKRESFSSETYAALCTAGYRTAFSFYAGLNRPGRIEPFDVLRCGVDRESMDLFRLRLAARAVTGQDLI